MQCLWSVNRRAVVIYRGSGHTSLAQGHFITKAGGNFMKRFLASVATADARFTTSVAAQLAADDTFVFC